MGLSRCACHRWQQLRRRVLLLIQSTPPTVSWLQLPRARVPGRATPAVLTFPGLTLTLILYPILTPTMTLPQMLA